MEGKDGKLAPGGTHAQRGTREGFGMFWLDTAILAALSLGAIFGARSGLVWQLGRVLGLAASIYIAIAVNAPASTRAGPIRSALRGVPCRRSAKAVCANASSRVIAPAPLS